MAVRAKNPIEVRNVLNLPAQGVQAEDVTFRSLSITSDKALCVRQTSPETKVSIIDTSSGQFAHSLKAKTDAASLSPNTKFLVVRVGQALQLQNMEANKKMKGTRMPDEDQVVFMKWIDDTTVGVITQNSVYHWNASDDSHPEKVFDRHNSLADCKMIIDYSASADKKWMMLVGLAVNQGTTEGRMQLYSVERKVSQGLPGFAGCFTTFKPAGRPDTSNLFCFVQRKPGEQFKLQIIEVGGNKASGNQFRIGPTELPVPSDATNDFPVTIHAAEKNEMVYILTKMGYAYVFDMHTGSAVGRQRVSQSPIFASSVHESSGGVLAVTTKTANVILVTLDENSLVPFVANQLRNSELAMQLAGRLGLGGAGELFEQSFNQKLNEGDVEGAAKIAAKSPGSSLRNLETIRRIQNMPAAEGQRKPIGRYFTVLIEHGRLNAVETVELAGTVLAQGRSELLQKWLREDKITCSDKLGDLASRYDPKLALEIYKQGGESHQKVVQCLMSAGEYDKIVPYAQQHGYHPNYEAILENLVHTDPKAAQEVATRLVKNETGPLISIDSAVAKFKRFNRLRECTGFLLDALSNDKPQEAQYQTQLLEMNLTGGDPQTADYILGSDTLHHFDHEYIAKLCERAGLFQRAMELYTKLEDIKRCMTNTARLSQDFLINFFGTLTREDAIECIRELMKNRSNEPLVVKIASKYGEQLGAEELIEMFEERESWNGLFYFLGAIVNDSDNPTVHFKYIVAAAKLKHVKEVERVCRDSKIYDPEEVKNFLLEAKLPDPRPLIHVCDRHGYIEDMTTYLYTNNLLKFIEVYVSRVSPQKAPAVVGKLLDLDADESFVKRMLELSMHECPVEPLVEEVEKRNRLRLLQPWLEAKISEGNTEPSTHNALGKIYVTMNQDPQTFLTTNQFYDSNVLGKFCEKLDPYLAFLAYKRAAGACDEELLEVTNKNGLFKDQARYLVEKQDRDLWSRVLNDDNPHRQQLIDQVIGTALPESTDDNEVSTTVRAFMDAQLPGDLIGLLEKLVLHGDRFNDSRQLQNLLLITAIKCSNMQNAPNDRVMEYISRLDNFDADGIADIALREEYQLYEEAFAIYKKSDEHLNAVKVLINNIENLDRAHEYAERVDQKDVWVQLAHAQLEAVMIKEAVDSYIRAQDVSNFERVIQVCENEDRFEDLVRYLEMARKKKKERAIDTALVYSLAQCNRQGDLEILITSPNVADIQGTADRCFDEGLYEAAKILYTNANNNSKLATTLVRLGEFQNAVDASIKANNFRSLLDVNAACVEAGEFRLAQKVGLKVIFSPDHLEDVVAHYERNGHFTELIEMMEIGSSSDEAHQGIFTELGVLYSRYRPEKLMEHIKVFWSRVNVSRLMRACEAGRHWQEASFLQTQVEEYDSAIQIMIEHSPIAFAHDKFLEIISKVRNPELYYRAINFYLDEEPMRLERLLQVLTPKLDHSRVVHLVRKSGQDNLPLILPYLRSVQSNNLSAVNEAVNEILVDDEDYQGLQESIDAHNNFDQLDLAKRMEKHELLEFRRIAARLYRQNKRYHQSIELSKSDHMYKDAIATAAQSDDVEACNTLLRFFLEEVHDKESFAATLYTCYHLVAPDVALELAWRNRVIDFVMPYMIQYVMDSNKKLAELDKRTAKKEEKSDDQSAMQAAAYGMYDPNVQMLANEAYGAPGAFGGAPMGAGAPQNPSIMPYGQQPQQPGQPPQAPDVYTMGGANVPGSFY